MALRFALVAYLELETEIVFLMSGNLARARFPVFTGLKSCSFQDPLVFEALASIVLYIFGLILFCTKYARSVSELVMSRVSSV